MTVKEVAESAVRETVGGSEIRPFSRARRQRTKDTAQKLMQDMLDQHSGAKRSTRVTWWFCLSRVMTMWVSLWFAAFS